MNHSTISAFQSKVPREKESKSVTNTTMTRIELLRKLAGQLPQDTYRLIADNLSNWSNQDLLRLTK